jgi:hypothetical protein
MKLKGVIELYIAEKFLVSLIILAHSISYYLMIDTGFIGGDIGLFKIELEGIEVFFIYIINILLLLLAYKVCKHSNVVKSQKLKRIFVNFNDRKVHLFIFIMLLGQILFLVSTGVGRLLSGASSQYSFIFQMIHPDFLILIYYLKYRENSKVMFWLNILLFSIFTLLQGYTGFMLTFFIFELYFYFRDMKISAFKSIVVSILLPISMLTLGSVLYQYVYPLKMEIRGLSSGYIPLDYQSSLQKLSSRLTFFPVSVGAFQRGDEVEKVFVDSEMDLKELVGFFRPIAPSFLFDKSSFNSLSNDVLRAYKPDIIISTGTDIGIFGYVYLLMKSDFLQGVLYIISLTLLTLLLKKTCKTLLGRSGNFLFFIFMIKGVYYTASLEVIYTDFFKFLLFVLPIMFIFRVVRIYLPKPGIEK